MNFSYQDLVSGPLPTSIKSVAFRLPLTPFFNDPGRLADQRTRGFHGDDFFLQNKSTREFKEDGTLQDDPICGFEGFRKSVSVDFDEDPPGGTAWNGTLTRAYVFDQDNNSVQAQTEETGRHTIGLTHTRTITKSNQNDLFIDPGPPPEPDKHVEITLSEPVNKAWLLGELERWMAEPEEFRDATGTGLGTYSYIGQGATRSESDGFLAIVGGGDVVALGPTFYGEPYGMVGDEAETWNGNFSAWVKKVAARMRPRSIGNSRRTNTTTSRWTWGKASVAKATRRSSFPNRWETCGWTNTEYSRRTRRWTMLRWKRREAMISTTFWDTSAREGRMS